MRYPTRSLPSLNVNGGLSEINCMKRFISIIMTVVILSALLPFGSKAEDNERVKQIRSMELTGYWDYKKGGLSGGGLLSGIGDWVFRAAILKAVLPYTDTNFYESTYRNYSGYSGGRFHEYKSKEALNVAILRSSLALLQQERMAAAMTVKDTITPVFDEHLLLAVDRNVDKHYVSYREVFDQLGGEISQSLSSTMRMSKGMFKNEVYVLQQEFELISEQIKYLHKSGLPSYELESSQRQQGYEDCKIRLEKLSRSAAALAEITETLFTKHITL